MAKPILLMKIPLDLYSVKELDDLEELYLEKFPDYNVIVTDVSELSVEIITEHNQPQGLSV
jgi:hypothetical protein